MNLHIGQDVVCIDVGKGDKFLKLNTVYKIKSLKEGDCKCSGVLVDVGIRCDPDFWEVVCSDCNFITPIINGVVWYQQEQFRPLDTIADISELTEVLNEPAFQ